MTTGIPPLQLFFVLGPLHTRIARSHHKLYIRRLLIYSESSPAPRSVQGTCTYKSTGRTCAAPMPGLRCKIQLNLVQVDATDPTGLASNFPAHWLSRGKRLLRQGPLGPASETFSSLSLFIRMALQPSRQQTQQRHSCVYFSMDASLYIPHCAKIHVSLT